VLQKTTEDEEGYFMIIPKEKTSFLSTVAGCCIKAETPSSLLRSIM